MAKQLFIQPGMPKTGTTTLQNRIFQNHDEYLYLGKHNPGYTPQAERLDDWILTLKRDLICKELSFFEKLDFEQLLSIQFGEAYEQHDKLFLSEEDILARCITPGKYGDLVRIGSAYNIFTKLKVMLENSSFSSVKIILVLRKQDDLIESFFAEEYHNFNLFLGMESPREFINYLFKEGRVEETDALFRYYSLISHLDSLFGEENVLVLPYEKLKSDPEGFLKELSTFMEITLWENIEVLKRTRDNNRDAGNKNGKVAKVRPLRKKMARFKNQLIGDVSTGLGRHLKFIDNFQKETVIALDDIDKDKVLLNYAEENKLLHERVKFISECNYY